MEVQKRETEEEHDRLRSILASIGDAVVAVDHDGRIVATNTVYERLFGGPAADIQSEDVAGLPFAPDDRPQQRAARGERFRVEFAVSDPDGKRRWFEAVAEPLTASDRTWGGVVSIRDISERTMRLSLERLMAAAGHELKTPTAAIHNYLQLVERRLASGDTAEAATYAARAVVQAQRLNELIERLYDVSRIQTGQLEIVSRPMDLTAVVREAVDLASVLPDAPAIGFDARPATLPILGDAGRLEQVVLNLLANAIEHGTGTEAIEVVVRRADGQAEVRVRDHGPGIAAEDLAGLFDAYTRAGHPRETGLGLGLFVAREIVTAHARHDHCDVRGRRRDHVHRPPAGRARRPPGAGHPRQTPRVVIRLAIVEDHPALADGLAALIRGSSDVEVVGTAPDVADGASAHRPHVARRRALRHPAGSRRRRLRPRRPLPEATRLHHAHGRVVPELPRPGGRPGRAGLPVEDGVRRRDPRRDPGRGGRGSAYPSAARRSAAAALRVPTSRELDIVRLVAEGLSNGEIADRLALRVKTVESQLRRLFDRYDVSSRTALVRLALRQGWIDQA